MILYGVEFLLVKFPASKTGKSKGLDVNEQCIPGQPVKKHEKVSQVWQEQTDRFSFAFD